MHITAVELENIKSYVDAKFAFQPGKIAITGENGAGKTSIIEAIAWALFDHLEYKKEEFVRRGAKSGVVRVTFQSGLDNRQYTVLRDTETSYYVFDPIFGARFARLPDRLADKKDEVLRFVRQHLGIEPGTDLRALYRQAIGVPQGTFTAIFLEGAAERKSAFDKLLKVEEYRQGAEKLRDTARFVEGRIVEARLQIARVETEISRSEAAEKEFALVSANIAVLTGELDSLKKEIEERRVAVAELDKKERKFNEYKTSAERLRSEKERAELVFLQKRGALENAQESAKIIETVRSDAAAHVEILARLAELERERKERDKHREELAKTERAAVTVNADRKRIENDLNLAIKAHIEIDALRPRVAEQKKLEYEIRELRERFGHSRSLEERLAAVNEDLERLRAAYREQQSRFKELEVGSAAAESLVTLEKKDAEIVGRIAALNASLERDQKFQAEVKNGLCPILSEKCLNLRDGQTLDGFITSQFSELRGRIVVLEGEKTAIDSSLRIAREAQKNLALLDSMRTRITELTEEGQKLRAEKDALEKRLEGAAGIEKLLGLAEAELKRLDNPEARVKFVESTAARENDLRQEMTGVEKNIERLESDRRLLIEQLDGFKDVDVEWERSTTLRDVTAPAHRTFVQHEAPASSLAMVSKEFDSAENIFADLSIRLISAEDAAVKASGEYDAASHAAGRASLLESEKRSAGTTAALEAATDRRSRLSAELEHFVQIRKTMNTELVEKERLEKISEMTAFIRDTLKESGPRVARNYVFLVSAEANQLFGEITGNIERTLKWNEDYGITLDDGGYERPFVSLSGGEQMAAALSIRLAILTQLSGIRIAFFDEPTTNMDAERRENLAQQISQIRNFDQLFVISHDDTFEGYVDEVIALDGKNEG